jgi:putative ABC transport system permease protein
MKKSPQPPRWATRLLQWYCAPHLLEEIQGDLDEEFAYQVQHAGLRHARRDYIRSVLGFMRPFAVKRKKTSTANPSFTMYMLKHYFLIATRNLFRQKVFSAINIAGLALGMICCLFIFLWIKDERMTDNFHRDGEQLYNVYETVTTNNVTTGSFATTVRFDKNRTYIPIADIQEAVPEVEAVSLYATGYELPWGYPETFQHGDKKYKFEGSRATDDFLSVFSYEIIAGQKAHALQDLSSIALSRKMAEMFFDTPSHAIGKTLRYENRIDFTVTAVFEDVPVHSSLRFDFIINWESHMTRLAWASPNVLTTLKIKENSDIARVEQKINRFVSAQLDPNDPRKVKLGLQQFGDRYLMGNFENGKPAGGRITYVNIFTSVAIFILIIACINFMNLATARSMKRAKEIGVKKVVGSTRANLIAQFLGESTAVSFIALIISMLAVQLLLPSFNTFTHKQIASPFREPSYLLIMGGILLTTALLSGSYPAFFLSALKPVKILKGGLRFSSGSFNVRKGLAILQFTITIMLLIVTIVITTQTDYVTNTNLGYDRENLLYMQVEGELTNPNDNARNYNKYITFKEKALTMPGIAMVDKSSETPHAMGFIVDMNDGNTETQDGTDAINWEGKEHGESVAFNPMSVGFDFVKTMNLQMIEGRDFSRAFATDSSDAFIVNEEAVKQMGMKDPLGKWVSAWKKKGHIIGVVKNYHTNSLHEPIRPLLLDVKEYEYFGVILVKTLPGMTTEALSSLEQVYRDVNPNYPFSYKFVDQEYENMYRSEQIVSKLSNMFAIIAIVISCLGLLGLVMFSAEQRTREFGIRKVLGATVANIVGLLCKDYVRIVLISFFIASPLAGYLMYRWLQDFAYKIDLSWWIFAVAGLIALFISLLTICTQALQSAMASPARTLQAE